MVVTLVYIGSMAIKWHIFYTVCLDSSNSA